MNCAHVQAPFFQLRKGTFARFRINAKRVQATSRRWMTAAEHAKMRDRILSEHCKKRDEHRAKLAEVKQVAAGSCAVGKRVYRSRADAARVLLRMIAMDPLLGRLTTLLYIWGLRRSEVFGSTLEALDVTQVIAHSAFCACVPLLCCR